MLIAVTGAGGFLGRYSVAALMRRGHSVRALVGRKRDVANMRGDVTEWREGELRNHRVQAHLVDRAQVVIHLAMDWERLNQGALSNLEGNLIPTLRLLELSRQAGCSQFLFISSLDVYTGCTSPPALTEDHATHPTSHYGAFKSAIEQHLLAYHGDVGWNASAWRPAAMYGLHHDLSRTLWRPLIKAARPEPRDSQTAAHVVRVEDVAEALALAVGDHGVAGQVYNLVDTYVSWQQVAELATQATGRPSGPVHASPNPKQIFDNRKAIAFFEHHGQRNPLRHGLQGMREHVSRVLAAL